MQSGFSIAIRRKIPTSWLILCLMLLPSAAFSQLSVNIKPQVTCQLADIFVPVAVSGFNDVGAFTLFIHCDPVAMQFIALENPDTLLTGGLVDFNFIDDPVPGISISWFRMTPVNISNGKLFDLHLKLLDSTAYLVFSASCEVALSDLSVVQNVIYNNGYIAQINKLNEQPQSLNVAEQKDTIFSVSQFADVAYQWQTKVNGNWVDVSDSEQYSGTKSNEMHLQAIPYSFDKNHYRCVLTYGECSYNSGEAELRVSAMSVPESGKTSDQMITVYPNPLHSKLHIIVNCSLDQAVMQIVDLDGRVILHSSPKDIESGETMDFELNSPPPGIYLLQVFDRRQKLLETQKIAIQ